MPATVAYTDQQRAAIEARQVSLSLDAGAGCGKTFVLTERFLAELAADGSGDAEGRLSQLVAITFTDAAARELRSRIRKLVQKQIVAAVGEQRTYWIQLGRAIDACRVSTIHSLCGNLLREHAFEVGLDPLFSTLDASAAAVLEAETIEDELRELLTASDQDTLLIATAWGIERTKKIVSGLMEHHRKPAFEHWSNCTPDDATSAWERYYQQVLWQPIEAEVISLARELLDLAPQVVTNNATEHEAKAALLNGLDAFVEGRSNAQQLKATRDAAVANRKPFSASHWPDKEMHAVYQHVAKAFRDLVDSVPHFDAASEVPTRAAELGLAALRVAGKAAKRYQQVKLEHGAIDFDDLLSLTHRLLSDPRHARLQQQLQDSIGVLFVDEFQDTDRVQVDIVKSLVGDLVASGKLFFVGDDKQSIYRFRGAEPQVFVDLRSEVDEKWRLALTKNFRSQPAILNFVNTLFGEVFSTYQPLVPHRSQVTPEPAVEFLWTDVSSDDKKKGGAVQARQAEARAIAARLRQLIDGKAPIVADEKAPDGRRAARYGDIAILFRALSDVSAYEEALRAEEIPYYLVGGHAFYTQQEIYDILHLLRVVASDCDELSLAGVLRSPFFALADETIFWLAAKHKSLERGLFAGGLPVEIEGDERQKALAAAKTLALLRSMKETHSVPQLLALAMEQTGFDAALLADFMGERKLANVYKLIEQARSAEANGVGSLDDFVTQLDTFIASTPKEALATTSPGTADVVQLMTVHKSKGLEFPIVVVPDLERKPAGSRDQVVFDPTLGPLVKDPDAGDKDITGLHLFRHVDKQADADETDRQFYVACTRAADYLLLSSSIDDLDKLTGSWTRRLAEVFDLQSGELRIEPPSSPDLQPRVHASLAAPLQAQEHRGGRSLDWLKTLEAAKRAPRDAAAEQAAAPLGVDAKARRRFSVTRLSGQIIPAGGDWWRSDTEANSESGVAQSVDPLGFGTLVHAVLERADLDDAASIALWAKALAPQHDLLHADDAAALAQELVQRFAGSQRAEELRTARQVKHELEFSVTWPLDTQQADARYLQGYLDCLYQGADGLWRVVDYKTNQVAAAGVPNLAAKYELQMLVYGLAVEQAWGTGPAELVLHFLRPGVEHVTRWNDSTRRRAIQLVTKAMNQLAGNVSEAGS